MTLVFLSEAGGLKISDSDEKETNHTKRESTQTEKKTDLKPLKGFTFTDKLNSSLEPVGSDQLRSLRSLRVTPHRSTKK